MYSSYICPAANIYDIITVSTWIYYVLLYLVRTRYCIPDIYDLTAHVYFFISSNILKKMKKYTSAVRSTKNESLIKTHMYTISVRARVVPYRFSRKWLTYSSKQIIQYPNPNRMKRNRSTNVRWNPLRLVHSVQQPRLEKVVSSTGPRGGYGLWTRQQETAFSMPDKALSNQPSVGT